MYNKNCGPFVWKKGPEKLRRILQLAGRSKSARPVCEKTVDGVILERVESENLVQLDPQLVPSKPGNT